MSPESKTILKTLLNGSTVIVSHMQLGVKDGIKVTTGTIHTGVTSTGTEYFYIQPVDNNHPGAAITYNEVIELQQYTPIQEWRFLYTLENTVKKALTKTGHPRAGVSKYVVTKGMSYTECYSKARQECKFKEHQLIGSLQIN